MQADDPVLAATRAEVVAYGVRRATMTSVARRAGISRATLYRRTASFAELVQDALVAEFEGLLSALEGEDMTSRAGIVRATRSIVEALANDDFTRALIAHDPEMLLPYLVDRLGRSQEAVLDGLSAVIAAAQGAGGVRDGDPRVLALVVLQALTPYVVGLRVFETVAGRAVWFDEAAHLVDSYLAPHER